ncbi:MAG: hypothetical protein R3257_07710, partial [bacterium]|nr:hypothetical protein [bacterium]
MGSRGASGLAITQNSSTPLGTVISNLEGRLRGSGASAIPPSLQLALASLRSETQGDIFFRDLLALGREEMRANRLHTAAPILDSLAHPHPRDQVPAAIQSAANMELATLNGDGPLGSRL